jgi:glycosyltransferase involved in cell wall biosynthesis
MNEAAINVSVVIPAYNAAATLGRAVGSVLGQTEQNLQVLIIDDASTDDTAEIAAGLAARDHRVALLRRTVNGGPAAARNLGLAQARGRWIALLDADDAFVPHRLTHLMGLGEQQEADLVCDNLLLCSAQGSDSGEPMIHPRRLPNPKWMSAAEFVTGNIGSRYRPRVSYGFMKPLMRRAFLQRHDLRYDENNRFGEDFLFSLACLLCGARWWLTPRPLYRYTVRPGTLTDVQSAADLLRIRRREEDLLRRHWMVARDPALATALQRHKRIIEHFYYYRAFTDALKAKALVPAMNLLLESPRGFRHIVTESALQAPRVALKALRGGFRQSRSMTAAVAAGASDGGTRG